ncbi:DNA polymerase III subunit gamma/tau [Actinomyces graevenitzii]|uniref:DNA polymerase III subunit gamma and tau n=1 Tax=Actinomyces graevenitzii TaxID=55565 RepID=UPI000C7F8600|nr:DNA polymerase III subunit gamma and tau [Actinomyces graevenitzii]PMC91633.1 DNA polymerase III subunit gamma/tau [Actinomyces graevenitzii]
MTTALYRRYRPDTFQQVIGQEHVTEPLMAALRANRVNHAYLFSGPRGCGKTTSARILARCLNCEQGPTDTPCGVCPSCVDLATGGSGSLDVVEIDAASHNSVEDARELRERASFAPARDTYKIFILDEAHMVTNQGFNALLKLVEEPPPHVKFIFATTEPEKVIGTIRSRTHHYPFRLVPPPVLEDYLRQLCHSEKVEVGDGVLPLVVRAGGGSVRDTLSVLDQLIGGSDGKVDYEQAIGLLGFTDISLLDQCVDAIAARDGAACFEVVQRVVSSGHDPRRFVEDLLQRLRDLLILAVAGDQAQAALGSLPVDQLERMQVQARALGAGQLSRCADMCAAALGTMVGATSPRLQLELLMARLLVVGLAQPTTAPRSLPGGGSQGVVGAQGQDGAGRASVGSGRTPEGSGREAARAALQRANMAIPVLAEAPSGPGVGGGVGMNVPVAPNAPAAPSVPGSVPGTPSVPAGPSAASAASSAPAARSAAAAGPATAGSAAQTRSAAQAANSAAVRPAQGSGAGSSSPSELIRNRWGEVLAKVKAASRVTNALVGANAQPGKVSGETFTLIFASPGLVRSFNSGRHPQVVAGALYEALGLRLQVQAVSDGEAAAVAEPGSAPYPPSAASATHVGGRQGRGNEVTGSQTVSRQAGQGADSRPAQRSKPTRREAAPAREAAPSAWDQPAPASWDEDWEVVQIPNSGNAGPAGAEAPVDQALSDSHGGAPTGGPAGGVPTVGQAGDPASVPAGGPTDAPQTMGGPQAAGSPKAGGQDDWAGGGQFDQGQDSVYFGDPAQGEGQARGQFDAVPGGASSGLATVTAGSAAIAPASAASVSSHLAPASPIAPATPMASVGSSAAAAALAASRANHPSNGAASANTWESTWEAAPIPTPDNYTPVAPEPELATVHRLHPLPALPNGGAQAAPATEAAHSWQPDPGASSRMAQAIAAARAAANAGGVVDDEEDMPSMDDADADESGAVGIEVVKRLLGAKVIEEVTVRADDR